VLPVALTGRWTGAARPREACVEKLLREVTGSARVIADADGDHPVRYGSALYFFGMVGDTHARPR
jgi:hypothetical protein